MRLLNVETMKLEEYFVTQTPNYAILSHCWGKDEVTFNDINGPNWRERHGAKKIEFAASQCRRDSMSFIWIDTCCIDKSSSAELSEAINSMYRWYARSELCYAYLEDVVLGFDEADDPHVEPMIRMSKWFTRGWTLQELIASNRIIFLDSNWSMLGTSRRWWLRAAGRNLLELLSDITTIPREILNGSHELKSCSVARKMSWAAKRHTSREEDMAYCLLGIFEVNMPLLYGEGMRAFIRLQEEILKETDDQTLFAWGLRAHTPHKSLFSEITDARAKSAGVFATSPHDFAGSGNIVPFPSKSDRQPFSMTNRGLRIELPLLNYNRNNLGSSAIAMLDCHYENDFSSVIGIFLEKDENDPTFMRGLEAGGSKIAIGQAEKADIQTIYIRKQQSIPRTNRNLKCIIRCESLEQHGFQILRVNSRGWHAETMVMELLPPSFNDTSASSIVFVNRSEGIYFAITLSIMHDRGARMTKSVAIVLKPERVGLDQWLDECASSHYTPRVRNPREYQLLTIQQSFGNNPPVSIIAHTADEEILNQHVIILEVAITGGPKVGSETVQNYGSNTDEGALVTT